MGCLGAQPKMRWTRSRTIRAALIGASCLLLTLSRESRAQSQSESWDALFIGNTKVGYIRTSVEPVKDRDRSLVNVRVDFNLTVRRGADSIAMDVQYGTIETPEGEVLRLDTRTHASSQVIRVHGDVVNEKMTLKIANGDQRQEQVIPWTADVRGPYGPELSFARSPMKQGEVRKLKTFVPDVNKVVEATLTAQSVEKVPLGGGAIRDLLRVEQAVVGPDNKPMPEMSQTFWVDSLGQVLKTFNDTYGGITAYRTTKEAATRKVIKADQFDLIGEMVVKVARKITNPENSRDIVYKVSMTDADPFSFFPEDRRQSIKSGTEPKTAVLTVKTAGPEFGEAGPETVGDEYLRSNPLVTSNDLNVVRLARKAVGTATDPWQKAQAITRWVANNIKNKNFETSFAPADEVARTLQGDCTEHGVLTAAMCRAEGIPARVVVGLVYASQLGGFGYHMWNEVYVNRRWVAVDSAFDQNNVDAVHLKLSETSLDGVSPFETFNSVARVATKLKIEAVEVR